MHYVEVIRDTLANVDPEGSPTYHANAATYLERLMALDKELEELASQIPTTDRKMVTDHDAFPYFAKRYGFTLVGNILGNTQADLSAGELAELTRSMKELQVKAVFSESQFSPKVTEAFAQDVGVRVVATLYTDSLSGGDEAPTYIDMMRYNMQTIVQALTGKPDQER
jgi:ABC-type Zn uptake system ZnuABC Zn-binding protein ZnuA